MTYNRELSSNKHLEIQVEGVGFSDNLLSISLRLSNRGDHAGLSFTLGCPLFYIGFDIYDTRHWDYKENRFKDYDM